MLNSKLTLLKNHFGIFKPSDWQSVEPAWILGIDGCGPQTLNYLRVLLAQHNLTLKGDKTSEHWLRSLPDVRIVDTLGDDEGGPDRGVLCPFTIYVDTAEQEPFTFAGMRADADQQHRPLVVITESRALGRHPDSLGDYSLDSGLGRCHIERKSMKDAQGTILGFGDGGRRERFERELSNLSNMVASCVIVECSYAALLQNAPVTTHRTAQQNAKTLARSLVAFQQDYRVPWFFCDSRRLAELACFRWLARFHEKLQERRKAEAKELKKIQQVAKTELHTAGLF
jgi:hypothetical protein